MVDLIASGLACQRGGRLVFSGIDFHLRAGELLQLTGPNGSGKSSLLRLIAGLSEPEAGTLRLEGGHPELAIGQQAHLVAHQDAIKPALTVTENLKFWRDYLGGGNLEAGLAALGLEALATDKAALLSAGQKRRLSLARLAMVPRVLWLLDEPTASLDAASVKRLNGLIRAHLAQGGLVIAATHEPLGLPAAVALDMGARG